MTKGSTPKFVLILVFVEDGLGGAKKLFITDKIVSLNPCFCGRWFGRYPREHLSGWALRSLNPCFCGRWFGSPYNVKVFLQGGRS